MPHLDLLEQFPTDETLSQGQLVIVSLDQQNQPVQLDQKWSLLLVLLLLVQSDEEEEYFRSNWTSRTSHRSNCGQVRATSPA